MCEEVVRLRGEHDTMFKLQRNWMIEDFIRLNKQYENFLIPLGETFNVWNEMF